MKNLYKILFVLLVGIVIWSCEDEDNLRFTVKETEDSLMITSNFASSYKINESFASNVAERVIWTEVSFGAPTTVTYELQGSISSSFDTYDVLGSTSDNNLPVNVDHLLDLADDLGLDDDPATVDIGNFGTVFIRVRAYVGDGASNEIEEISAYEQMNIELIEQTGEVPLPNLFFVGNATAADWNNNDNNTPMFRDPANIDSFMFTGKFLVGEFKLLEFKTQWQPQWGLDGGNLAVNDGTGTDPSSFVISSEGYYTVKINTDEMTYSVESFDESSATDYATIGFLGSARTGDDPGWDEPDTDMTQSSFDPHIWYATDVTLFDGVLKFRADDAWDANWGAGTAFSGVGTQDGANIPVDEGTYDIWFNDLDGRYILIPVE